MEAGGFYHVYNIGNNRETIFKEDCNYDFFLRRLFFYTHGYVIIHAFCLMPNHFHLLIEIPIAMEEHTRPRGKSGLSNIQRAFKNFFTSYAKSINKAYDRLGSLFKTKCEFKPINNFFQYRTTVAYIHYNPVKAKLSENYTSWPYSSYPHILKNNYPLIHANRTLEEFGGLEQFLNFHDNYKR